MGDPSPGALCRCGHRYFEHILPAKAKGKPQGPRKQCSIYEPQGPCRCKRFDPLTAEDDW